MEKGIVKGTRVCDYCGNEVEIFHNKRMTNKNIFCNKLCEAKFKTKKPNTRCYVCGKFMAIKPSRLNRLKHNKICCSRECSNKIKEELYTGKNNPNHKHDKDLSMFYDMTHNGAYVLGLIYSDGHLGTNNTVSIFQKGEVSGFLLSKISYMIFGKDVVKNRTLSINDKKFVEYILSLSGIKVGKKAAIVTLPNLPNKKLMWSFICGYFDGDGGFKYDYRYPVISITSYSVKMLEEIAEYWGVNYTGKTVIIASGYKALDICGKMYRNVSLHHTKKYDYYNDILNWQYATGIPWNTNDFFKYMKLSKYTMTPTKTRVTDSGYDVYAVDIEYSGIKDIYLFDTKLAVEPLPGWYFDLIGRSSLPKFGFMFLGGVGVIDRSYVGSIKMYMKKLDSDVELPELPFKCGQLIPRPIIHAEFIEVDELGESDRGSGGFGSTGR